MHRLLLLTLSFVPVSFSDSGIVPGYRIGHVKIGQELPSFLGQPDHSDGAAGHVWSTWKGTTGNTLDVFGELGNAAGHLTRLVRVTSNYFHTSSGVNTGDSWGSIHSHFTASLVTTYDSTQFGRKLAIMDNKTKGIAFELTLNAANHVTNGSRCKAIWVHKKGVAFDPSSWVIYEPSRP
jgi:hypothetical protein